MRPVNLLVLARGFETVPQELRAPFEAQLSEREEPLDIVKPHEAESAVRLVRELRAHGATRPACFEGFVFSFRIPQISSEFDLLKITDDLVVNIELKSADVGGERIAEQLARTRHYLAPLGRPIRTYTFVSSTRRLFERDEVGVVRQVDVEQLACVLKAMGKPYDGLVEDLFRVGNYLVSPLNDTDKFLEGRYFLTNHQLQIRQRFLSACREDAEEAPVFLVYGSAGTGKSLLLYDIARSFGSACCGGSAGTCPICEGAAAKEFDPAHPVCVIHCGVLSEGHDLLNERQRAFRVVSAMDAERLDLGTYAAILADEAQRMWPGQLRHVVSAAREADVPLYLSLDRRQVLTRRSDACDVEQIVRDACPNVSVWELSRKIRTNPELVGFLRALFGLRGGDRFVRTRHVKVGCAGDASHARELVDAFREEGYQYISLGPAQDDGSDDALAIPGCPYPGLVVGQEFDKVVMAVGPGCSPDGDSVERQFLYQGLTRARSEIALVVYDNEPLLERLLSLT